MSSASPKTRRSPKKSITNFDLISLAANHVPSPALETIERNATVHVWRLPRHISQSRLADRTGGSHACTIIALKLAEILHLHDIRFPIVQDCIHTDEPRCTTSLQWQQGETGNLNITTIQHFAAQPPLTALCNLEIEHPRVAAGGPSLSPKACCSSESVETMSLPPQPRSPFTRNPTRLNHTSDDDEDNDDVETSAVPHTNSAASTSTQPYSPCLRPELVNTIVNCIIEGNEEHERQMIHREGTNLNFTIPDALEACGHAFVEVDYSSIKGELWRNMAHQIWHAVERWSTYRTTHDLDCLGANQRFCMLIIAYERSVLLNYDPQTNCIGLIDSHSHGEYGSIIAVAHMSNVAQFADWITLTIFPETWNHNSNNSSTSGVRVVSSHEFEISALKYVPQAERRQLWQDTHTHSQAPMYRGLIFKRKRARSKSGAGGNKSKLNKPMTDKTNNKTDSSPKRTKMCEKKLG